MDIQQYSRVRLTANVPDQGISVGDEGYVVEILEGGDSLPTGYMIELAVSHSHHAIDATPILHAEQLEVTEQPLDVTVKPVKVV